jgi:hypothetical protein
MAVALTFAFSASALAGIIPTTPESDPPPLVAVTGITDTPPSDQPVVAPNDPAASIALSLLQTVLSVI